MNLFSSSPHKLPPKKRELESVTSALEHIAPLLVNIVLNLSQSYSCEDTPALRPASAHSDAIKQSGSSCQQPNRLESISGGPFFGSFFFFFSWGRIAQQQGWANFQFVSVEVLSTWRNQPQRVSGVHIRQMLQHSALSNTQTQPGNRLASRCLVWSLNPRVCRTEPLQGRRTRVIASSCLSFLSAL